MPLLNEYNSNFYDPDPQDPWNPGGGGSTPPSPSAPGGGVHGGPYTPPVVPAPTPNHGGGGGNGASAFNLGAFPDYDFGAVPGFSAPEFVAPDVNSVLNSPDYQSRLQSGTNALEHSAAARGTLRTGGTLKDVIDYGKKFGQGEYDSSYNHSLGTYQANYQRLKDQYAPRLAGWQANAQAALQRALAIYGRGTAWNMPHSGGGGGGTPDPEPLFPGWTP